MPQIFGFSTSLNSCWSPCQAKMLVPGLGVGTTSRQITEDGDGYFPKQAVTSSGLLFYSLASM